MMPWEHCAKRKNWYCKGRRALEKTFVAKRLAMALIGTNDPQRIEMIQFHQSYSYEDFIQGFRPTAKGSFRTQVRYFSPILQGSSAGRGQE